VAERGPPVSAPVVQASALSVQQSQRRAALVLVDLLERDLPVAGWDVCDIYAGSLTGHISTHHGTETERAQWVTAWAAFLGAEACWNRYVNRCGGSFRVEGVWRGVPVRVWTFLQAVPDAGDARSTSPIDHNRPRNGSRDGGGR
jgi:hypothetical protein